MTYAYGKKSCYNNIFILQRAPIYQSHDSFEIITNYAVKSKIQLHICVSLLRFFSHFYHLFPTDLPTFQYIFFFDFPCITFSLQLHLLPSKDPKRILN